jgi:hypothetical protein
VRRVLQVGGSAAGQGRNNEGERDVVFHAVLPGESVKSIAQAAARIGNADAMFFY